MSDFEHCFWCKCPALKKNLTPITFAAEREQIPEIARKVLPPHTLFVVAQYVCNECEPKINGLRDKWEAGVS
jgi:hypothetical protein